MSSTSRRSLIAVSAVTILALTGCSGGNSGNSGEPAAESLVIDTGFTVETADPGNTYDPTGNMLAKALYETLVDFEGSDVSTPVPGLASWEQNDEATEFIFTLEGDRVFSDGSPVEAKDVVFSLQRIQGMAEAKPNFLLGGVTVEEVDESTVTFTTETPLLQLPAILANPALGIVNSDIVIENGGAVDGGDSAQEFLDGTSAGSGPFVLDTLDLSSQIVLTKNEEYNGDEESAFDRVVIRNVPESATQLANLKGGDTMVTLDLNGDQVAGLDGDFTIDSVPSGQTIFLLLNHSAEIAGELANVKIAEAIRYSLDYDSLLELAGAGAVQATGVIPPAFEGALDEGVGQDLDRAEAALAESGYAGETLTLQFPNDYPVGGVDFTSLAERVQAQLGEVGITVELAPAPFATELDAYVNGTESFGLWFWGPDYADSANFLPFGPGLKVGLRSGWAAEANPELADLAATAASSTDAEARTAAFTAFAEGMQAEGPFVPLIVPARNIAAAGDITGSVYNSVWELDIAEIAPAG